jgi:ribose 1,5-bisphosphate isomerase
MVEGQEELIRSIKDLEIQGANEIAVHSLRFLRKYAKEKGFGKGFDQVANKIEKTRPTAVVLHNCIEILKEKRNLQAINKLLRQMSRSTNEIAKRGSRLIKNNSVIMTHCHSSEALAVIKQAWKEKKKIKVYATVTEPKHQGIKTAKELARLKIPVELIIDSAAEMFMRSVDMVIVGCDAIRKEGVVNKIGTFGMAVNAKENKKPFYVVGDTLKLDRRKKLIIEERCAHKEVCMERMKTLEVRDPAFDVTPWKYVKRVVTEKGVMTPGNVLRMLKK